MHFLDLQFRNKTLSRKVFVREVNNYDYHQLQTTGTFIFKCGAWSHMTATWSRSDLLL